MSQENILDELVQNLSSNSWNELLSACFDRGISQNTVLNYMADRNSICLLEASMDFEATAPAEISEALDSDSLFFTSQPSQTPDTLTPDTLTTPNDGLDDYFFSYANDDNDTFDLTNFSDQTNQQANQPTNQPTSQQTKQQDSQPNSDVSEFLYSNDIDMFFNDDDCTCIFYPEINKQPTCPYCEAVLIEKEKKEEDERKNLARKKLQVVSYANHIFSAPVRLEFYFDE